MAKHARPRSPRAVTCPAGRTPAPRGRQCGALGSRKHSDSSVEAGPTRLGVVTNRADFELLRATGCTDYASFADYLVAVEAILDELRGSDLYGRAFSPEEFQLFCDRNELTAEDADSHLAYTADPEAEEEWVRWSGEPLPEFLLRLERASERARARRRIEKLLGETAEAALTGVFPEPLLRLAYARGAEALRGFLLGAGEGVFTVVCGLFAGEEAVTAWADLALEPGGILRIDDEDLDLLCEVLCVGHALNLNGVVTLAGVCETRGEVGWEWSFDGEAYSRLDRQAVE